MIEEGTLIFNTSDGLTPIAPIDKDASLGDIMVMKEMPERYFRNAFSKKPDILKEHYVSAIIDLGEIYSPYADLRFSMYIFEKQQPEYIKIAVFKESLYISEKPKKLIKSPNCANLSVPEKYPDVFFAYMDELESWLNEDIAPVDSFYATLNK